jgi:hypothetical protein
MPKSDISIMAEHLPVQVIGGRPVLVAEYDGLGRTEMPIGNAHDEFRTLRRVVGAMLAEARHSERQKLEAVST